MGPGYFFFSSSLWQGPFSCSDQIYGFLHSPATRPLSLISFSDLKLNAKVELLGTSLLDYWSEAGPGHDLLECMSCCHFSSHACVWPTFFLCCPQASYVFVYFPNSAIPGRFQRFDIFWCMLVQFLAEWVFIILPTFLNLLLEGILEPSNNLGLNTVCYYTHV